jgi:hypothetical protein
MSRSLRIIGIASLLSLGGFFGARSTPLAHASVVSVTGGKEILNSGGPLAEIDVSSVGTIQVYDNRVCATAYKCREFYDYSQKTSCAGSVGVGVVLNGVSYGPSKDDSNFNCNYEFDSWDVQETPISQVASGNTVTTLINLGGHGLLIEILTYKPGTSYFGIRAIASGANPRIYIGGEEDPGNNEDAYNYHNPVTGAVGGYNPWDGVSGHHPTKCGGASHATNYYIGEVPVTPAAHWIVGGYADPNDVANAEGNYPDAVTTSGCNDLGFGLEWIGHSAAVNFTFGSTAP